MGRTAAAPVFGAYDSVVNRCDSISLSIILQTAVVKEALRLSYGVTTRLPRVAQEDIRYKEYIIPAGVSAA